MEREAYSYIRGHVSVISLKKRVLPSMFAPYPPLDRDRSMHWCRPHRPSVCAGHESEVICIHNFMPRAMALEVRARLDEKHAQLLAGSQPPAASRRPAQPGLRPHREAGSDFNQTEVLRLNHRHETGLRAQLWHGAQSANKAGNWGYRVESLPRNVEALQSVRAAPHTRPPPEAHPRRDSARTLLTGRTRMRPTRG